MYFRENVLNIFLLRVTRLPGASAGFRGNSDLGAGVGVDDTVVRATASQAKRERHGNRVRLRAVGRADRRGQQRGQQRAREPAPDQKPHREKRRQRQDRTTETRASGDAGARGRPGCRKKSPQSAVSAATRVRAGGSRRAAERPARKTGSLD